MLDEVIFKVVENDKAERGGSCQVTRTEAKHEGNKEEDLSVSVAAQVLFHLYNGIKYLIYFWFVRYYVFEISHISYIHEILNRVHFSSNTNNKTNNPAYHC